jgi:hypothetical protein
MSAREQKYAAKLEERERKRLEEEERQRLEEEERNKAEAEEFDKWKVRYFGADGSGVVGVVVVDLRFFFIFCY